MKIVGLGLRGYFKDDFNKFDAFIILVGTIDIILLATL